MNMLTMGDESLVEKKNKTMAKLGDVFPTQGYRNIIRLFEAVPEHRELYVREESMHSYPLLLLILY